MEAWVHLVALVGRQGLPLPAGKQGGRVHIACNQACVPARPARPLPLAGQGWQTSAAMTL